MDLPDAKNTYQIEHARVLLESYWRWTGRELIRTGERDGEVARRLFEAPFVVVSHGTEDDPVFNYGNAKALEVFEMSWAQITSTPSRASAEAVHQEERARVMARVTAQGYIDDYAGVRVSRTGRRFRIRRATVWNVLDDAGVYRGQAAMFAEWEGL